MTGVHIIALVCAFITLTVILELSRRRHLHEKYAIIWLSLAVVILFFAIFPGLFNSLAHAMGVKNPPDLLAVVASLFLLVICVRLSYEIGRLEDRSRTLAEEIALLRREVTHLSDGRGPDQAPARPDSGEPVAGSAARAPGGSH